MNLGWLETSFAVVDLDRTTAWYQKLGFQVVGTADEGKSHTLVAGDCRLALYQGILDGAETHLIFWQGEVEACAAALADAGASFVRGLETNDRGEASFMVRDPDGRLLFVIRERGVTREAAATLASDLDRGFFQVSLPVKDPDRTAAFYELLGFHRRANDDPRVAPLTNGECRICLYQGYLDPDELQLNFWQGDIDAVAAVVRRAGLGFYREPTSDERGAGFMLTDPDGRPVFFINMRKNTAADFISETGEMLA
jgi:catechol 2,3-dioxygenase-like lactoylglutathione lyase family enzyme